MRTLVCGLLLFFSSLSLRATVAANEIGPSYDHLEILFRSAEFDGLGIGAGTYISNSHVRANDRGDVAIALKGIEYTNTQGLWLFSASKGKGEIIYRAPTDLLVSSRPALDNRGNLLFTQYTLGLNDGVRLVAPNGSTQTLIEAQDLERNEFYTDAMIDNEGAVVFKARGRTGEQALMRFEGGKFEEILVEGKGPSFLFSPTLAASGKVALKVRWGDLGDWSEERPDHIMLYRPGKGLHTLLDDQGEFADMFNNNLALNDAGDIAVIGSFKGEGRLIRTVRGRAQIIARVGAADDIKEFESFAPAMNNHGHVVFRALDQREKRSLYFFDGHKLSKVLSEGDLVPTDRETGRIESRPGWPGFSSGLALNHHNQLYFHCQIWNKSQEEHLGAALYKLDLNYLRGPK